MSSLQRLVITSQGSALDFNAQSDLAPGQLPALNNFIDYLGGLAGGNSSGASLAFNVGAVQATGKLTVATGGSTAAQACTILNVTLTAVAATPSTNQFVVSATAATQAANMAAAINASASFAGKITASALAGVVTLTSVVPGALGNGLQLSAGNLANVTASAFASGDDGTSYTLNLN